MKRIMSKAEEHKKQARTRLIIGSFLIGLMLLSVIGFIFITAGGIVSQASQEENPYGNYEVVQKDGVNFYFTSPKSEVENIPVTMSKSLQDYFGQTVYVSAYDYEVFNLLSLNLGLYVSRIQQACYSEEECTQNVPVKDCSQGIIVYRPSEENKVYQEEECVFVEGDLSSLDAFTYQLLGI